MSVTYVMLAVVWILGSLFVLVDASYKRGQNLGCLWSLVALTLGPIAVIGYILVRNTE
ncbi:MULTISPECIES: hypothetical protein [Bacillaceae]|uniref:hypothetical protein n=1 Tax=Bacillaceae TaxID=186817 RepID=UPI001BDF53E3|nr:MULTISPECIES: hypothetical protein [Bacillaceae]MDX8360275.1 hypothetical protein [Cytobacillus sp. IB215316]MDX8366150.1 hypothetical protein [Cytobacillus sp. IB215665]